MASAASQSVHPVAADAWGARPAVVAAYEAARPSYPGAALEHCVRRLGLAPGARVLEVAAGTGKFTRQLLAHPHGFSVTATEPNPGMCVEFARACPGAAMVEAAAARLPFDDGAFDAVFVAQAFHWFANPEACAEMARVLRPGGGLALVWNIEATEEPWMRELQDIVASYARKAGVPNYYLGTHKPALESPWFARLFNVAPGPAACSAFFRWQRPLTREAIWLRISSLSFVASLPEAEREGPARRAVDDWAVRHAGRFAAPPGEPAATFDMVTEAFVARRRTTDGAAPDGA